MSCVDTFAGEFSEAEKKPKLPSWRGVQNRSEWEFLVFDNFTDTLAPIPSSDWCVQVLGRGNEFVLDGKGVERHEHGVIHYYSRFFFFLGGSPVRDWFGVKNTAGVLTQRLSSFKREERFTFETSGISQIAISSREVSDPAEAINGQEGPVYILV